jgi:uncharacterized membrane protein YkoI
MKKRITMFVAVLAGALAVGTTFALGGARGLIWDDGHYAKPGALDDGKNLLAQTSVPLSQAVATAKGAATGDLGQVDLERLNGRIVYTVDIGSNEVHVDANTGAVASITPRD